MLQGVREGKKAGENEWPFSWNILLLQVNVHVLSEETVCPPPPRSMSLLKGLLILSVGISGAEFRVAYSLSLMLSGENGNTEYVDHFT